MRKIKDFTHFSVFLKQKNWNDSDIKLNNGRQDYKYIDF